MTSSSVARRSIPAIAGLELTATAVVRVEMVIRYDEQKIGRSPFYTYRNHCTVLSQTIGFSSHEIAEMSFFHYNMGVFSGRCVRIISDRL